MTEHRSKAPMSARALKDRLVSGARRRLRPDKVLLRQSLFVLLACAVIDLFPGYFLGSFEEYLVLVPGLLMILPPTVGLRGNIFGALAARLGSKLHLGDIEPHFKQNRELKVQLLASGIQLVLLSLAIPLVGIVIGVIFSMEMAGVHELLFISIIAAVISGFLMFCISFGITFAAFRKGWDPDNVSAPIIASAGDILTIPILFFCAYLSLNLPGEVVWVVSITAALVILTIVISISFSDQIGSRLILREATPVAVLAVIISTMSGLVLGAAFDTMLRGTIFLILIPAFNGQGGSMGSILGSRVTSAAYLGQTKMTRSPSDLAISSSISLLLISFVVFTILGIGAYLLGLLGGIPIIILELLLTLLIGSVLITCITSAMAYYAAYVSFKIGLDPDNVVIPILTACMDVVGSGTLVVGIILTGMVL